MVIEIITTLAGIAGGLLLANLVFVLIKRRKSDAEICHPDYMDF